MFPVYSVTYVLVVHPPTFKLFFTVHLQHKHQVILQFLSKLTLIAFTNLTLFSFLITLRGTT